MFYFICIILGIIVLLKWFFRVGLVKFCVYILFFLFFERRKINEVGKVLYIIL